MNTPNTPEQDAPFPELPEFTAERVDAVEAAVLDAIEQDRALALRRAVRRGRLWMGGAAAAAVVAVAAIIAPSVTAGLSGSSGDFSAASTGVAETEITAIDGSAGAADSSGLAEPDLASGSLDDVSREVVANAWASLIVDDIRGAADEIATAATEKGGYVESLSLGTGVPIPVDVMSENASTTAITTGWISVRIPADQLTDAVAELSVLGEITSSSIDRYDVTDQVIDLTARVDAAQASVDRLLELVAHADNVSDLIAAESALAERQATLESYQQQLESVQSQVAMSSLSVSLSTTAENVDADPAGFWDGIVAGWNGLIATLNGVVLGVGFLLPWIAVVAVLGAIVWGVVALIRRARS
ncbi:DUF4349 domain-containing protein [Microbacterium sediminicola]|uniref:DUF4349 domain-containing protein n=1 Tax=Microbacterium sediminicola TaxID=415210 RepID=A0ABN2HP66_9MICO